MDSERKKQMTLGVFFSYFSIVAKLLSGILYTPIILKSLGQSEYGVYSLCLSFTGYLTIFNAGMNAAYVRFYVQAREKESYNTEKINGMFLKIFALLGTIGMLGGLLLSLFAEPLFGARILPAEYAILKKSFVVLAFLTLFTSVNALFSSAIIAHEKFIVGKIVDLLHTVILPVVTIPLLLAGGGSIVVLLVNLAFTGAMLIFNAVYAVRKLDFHAELSAADGVFLRSVAVFAGFIALQGVMDQLNWQVDKLLLARFKGADEVAVYSVGSQFNSYFMILAGAVGNVFITEINRLVAHKDEKALSSLFVRVSRILAQLVVLIMSGFIVFGRPFISRWAGAEYGNSYYVGILLMLPITVAASQWLGQDIARAKNMHKVQILINFAVCVLNLLVSIPLARRYGAIGSAFGTFACEVIICIFLQSLYYQRVVKIDMRAYYREMLRLLPGWVPPFLLGAALNHFDLVKRSYGSIFAFGCLYLVVFAGSIWAFSLNTQEKGYIRKAMQKVVKHTNVQ